MNNSTETTTKTANRTLCRSAVILMILLFGLFQSSSILAQPNYDGDIFSSSFGGSGNIQLYLNGTSVPFAADGWYRSDGSHSVGNNNYYTGYIGSNQYLRSFFTFTNTVGTISSAYLQVNLFSVNQNSGGTITLNLWDITSYSASQLNTDHSFGNPEGLGIFTSIGTGNLLGSYAGITEGQAQTVIHVPITNLVALNAMGSSICIGGKVDNYSGYTPPTAITSAATNVVANSATLNGSINPNNNSTTVNFQYGTSSGSYPYATSTSVYSGSSTQAVSANLSSLSSGTTYYYRLQAVPSGNSTVYGSEVSFTTPPANPTSVTPGSSPICNGGSTTLTAAGVDGTVYWYTGSCGGTYVSSGNPVTIYPTTTTTYYARNYKNSQYSAGCASNTVTVNNPATIPSSASCSGTTSTTAFLTWGTSTGTGTITYYWVVGTSPSVTYGTVGSGGVAAEGTTTAPTTTATATGLTPSTGYYLRVYATTASPCGNSAYQTSSMFTTVPSASVVTAATLIRANSFTANWSASTGATNYYVDVSADNTFASYLPGYQNRSVGNVTSISLTGLSNNTLYYYRIRAYNTGGTSSNSNTITVTTLPVNNFLIEKVGGGNIADQTSGIPFSIQITARDAANSTVTDYTGNVTITTNSVITAGAVTANFIAGVLSSSSVTLTLAGTLKTLTATGGGVNSTSTTFTVFPADINHWTLVANGPVTAGTPFSVTATVYDGYGNVKTNYTGDHSVSWTTTAISSPNGTARQIPANGVQTFTAGVAAGITGFTFYNSDQSQLSPYSSPTITITDGPTSIAGTTAPITILNAPFDNFKVVAGTTQTAGIAFPITVTARDVYWNTCVDYAGSIRFKSSDDALVTFPAGLQSFSPAASYHGVRTFSPPDGISISTMGVYWVRAADAQYAYKSGQQENIIVGPGGFSSGTTNSTLTIADPLTPTTFVDPLNRIAGQYVWVVATPRDAQGNLLPACRDISIMLNDIASDHTGTIAVKNVGDGTYTALVEVTLAGNNTISASYIDSFGTHLFAQTRTAIVTAAVADLGHTLITADKTTMTVDQISIVTVQLKDIFDNNRTTDDGTVVLTTLPTGLGTLTDGSTTAQTLTAVYNGTGTGAYHLTLEINATGLGTAIVTGTLNSSPITDDAEVIITHGAATHLAIGTQPQSIATAGIAFSPQPVIRILDQFNNIVSTGTDATSTVTAGIATGPGSLFGTITAVASGGVATFSNLQLNTVGIYTLDFTKSGLTHIVSNSITVNHAAASKLAIYTQPSPTAIAGASFTIQPVINVLDAYNNIITDGTGSAGSVSAAIYSGPGTLLGTIPITASGGIASFIDLKTNTAGTITINFTMDGVTNVVSNSIIVGPASPTHHFTLNSPLDIVAGTRAAYTVTRFDMYGNVTTTGDQVVNLASTSDGAQKAFYSVASGGSPITTITIPDGQSTANFWYYDEKAGNWDITASATGITTATDNLTVLPAATNHYSLNAPADIIAGGTMAPYTVTRYDVYNNLKTAGAETVYLYSNSLGTNARFYNASSGGTVITSIALADGSSSSNFWYYDEKSGDWTITASDATPADGAIGIIDATDALTVIPATAGYLAITGNGTQVAGASQTITVTAYDAYNNVATGYTGAHNLTFSGANPSPSPVTNPTVAGINFGSLTSLTFASGVATGTMYLYKTETAHITATDGTINADSHKLDVVVSHATQAYLAITGNGTQVAGASQLITVTAYDTYNNVATGYTGAHNLTFSGANPSPSPVTNPTVASVNFGTSTSLSFNSGVATGTMYLYKVETAHITATDGTINADSHKLDVVVSHATQAYLAITGNGTQVAGASQTITVTAYDTYNNVATGYTGAQNLTFSGANPSPSPSTNPTVAGIAFGSLTSLTFASGVATGTMSLYKAETALVTATDGVINANSHKLTVVVSPATAGYLAITGTGTQVAGTSQTITVTAYDPYNNVATGYTGAQNLTFSGANLSPLPSTHPTVAGTNFGVSTSLTFASGIATGTMYLYKVETALVTATDGTINSTDHKLTVVVSPATAGYLAITGNGTQVAGSSQTITVTAYDTWNNVATTYTGSHPLTFTGANPTAAPVTHPTVAGISFGSSTSLTFASGVATGSMILYLTETALVTATDGVINADSHKLSVLVTPTLLKDFIVFGVPSPHDLGTSQSVTVEPRDTYNNIKTNYVGTITFSSTDAGATIPADYHYTSADAGVHIFTNLVKFSAAGSWWLTAIDMAEPTKYGAQANIIVQRAVTITANNISKTYGDVVTLGAMGTSAFTVTGIVSGVGPVTGDITGVTLISAGSVATATVSGSPYPITPSAATGPYNPAYYRIVYSSAGLLTVNPATLTVTANSGQTKVYGQADPTFTYTASGFKNGQTVSIMTGSLSRAPGEYVNTYAITQGNLSAGSNYTISFVPANFSITAKPITITATASQSKIYGNVDPTFAYTSTGLAFSDVFTGALARATGENVGTTYAINIGTLSIENGSGTNVASNYSISFVSNNFAITQLTVSVTADAGQSKIYGSVDPVFTYTSSPAVGSALPNGDHISFTGALARTVGETVGTYPINQNTLANSNYTISYTGANFAINPLAVTVTATASQSKIYGSVDPTFTYTSNPTKGSALPNGDHISFTGALIRDAGEDVGNYAIGKGSLANSNYTITYVADNFAITALTVTVTANTGQHKTYGDVNPIYSYTSVPAVGSPLANEILISYSGSLDRVTGETVGNYAIGQGTLDNSNYTITYVAHNFAITALAVTVTANTGQSKIYGSLDPVFTYTSSPAVGSPLANEILISYSGSLDRVTGETVGNYAIGQGTLDNSNYTITYVAHNFAITALAVTVTANTGQSKIYGSVDPVFTYTSSPAVGSPLANGILISYSGSLDRVTGETVLGSPYPIHQGSLANSNYNISYIGANFYITANLITGNFTVNSTKVYDGNTSAVILTRTLNGVISPDDVSLTGGTANYDNKNVGVGKTVTLTGYSLTGAQASNYSLTSVATTTANITVRTLTLSNFAADSKIYDGTTVATGIGFTDDRVTGDNLAFTRNAAFDTPDIGLGKPVNYTNIVISGGADKNNYELASTTGTAHADIYARSLILTATDVTKPYGSVLTGGTGYTAFTSSGLQNFQTIGSVTVAFGSGSQAADPVGNYPNSVVLSDVTGGTFTPGNYSISYVSGAINVIGGSVVSGNITYYNNANTPMNNVTVELWQSGSKVYPATGTITTNTSGTYTFPSILPGTYDVHMTTVKTTAGSINSGDAAQANSWSNSENGGVWPAIEKVRFFAGDVSGDNTIQPNDPSMILAYFVNSWTTWAGHGFATPRPDWTFWKPETTTVNSSTDGLYPQITVVPLANLSQNFYGLVTGDYNRSFIPGGAKSDNDYVRLDHMQTVKADANGVVELPLYAESPLEVGAVSLILNFPSDKLEILDVTMNSNTDTPLKFNVIGDELRIGWNSLSPLALKAADKLLTLKVRLIGTLSKDETLRFNLASNLLNELDDASNLPIINAGLSMDVIGSTLGIPTLGTGNLLFANYPNPFAVKTTFAYTLPSAGEVTLEILNMMGIVVQTMVNNEVQAAGDYKLKLDNTTFEPGVYMATLKLNSGGQVMTRIIKIVCTR